MLHGNYKFYISPNLSEDAEVKEELQQNLNQISLLFQQLCETNKTGLRQRLAEQRQKAEDNLRLKEQAEREREEAVAALEHARQEKEQLVQEMARLRAAAESTNRQ